MLNAIAFIGFGFAIWFIVRIFQKKINKSTFIILFIAIGFWLIPVVVIQIAYQFDANWRQVQIKSTDTWNQSLENFKNAFNSAFNSLWGIFFK
ncbi:MAG: hypothetical protein LBM27_00500 [Lactobacillaceae bacterium]|jgi:hypothetical protein|nr:hypothetical protein [Lactobacillaceae bacterium]